MKEDQELSASERLGAGLDAFPLVVFVLGGDDTIVDVYAGVSDPKQDVPTTLMGIHFLNIVPSDVATRVRESLVDVRTSKRSVSLEYRLEGARGTRFYEVRLFPLPGERVSAVVSDVSDTRIEMAGQQTPGWDLERSLIYSPAVVYSFELAGSFVSLRTVSSNVERILGHSSEVVLSAGWWDMSIHPDDRPAVHHSLRELVQQGHDVLEYRLRDARGHYRWIRQEQVYEDRGRTGLGVVVGSWIDITVEYEQRMALREREARLQTIVDTEPECVKLVAPDGSLIDMNPAGLRMLEAHSLEEVQQQTLIEYVTPEHRAAFVALSRRVFAGGEGTLVFEVQGLRGTRRWLETNAVPLRDVSGSVKSLLGITRDVTEHRAAVDALRTSEARYRQIIETTGEGVWTIDAESRTSFTNQRMAEMLGYTVDEMKGRSMFDFMDEEGQRIATRNAERRRAGMSEEHDFVFRKKDGTALWTRMLTNPMLDDSNTYTGALGMVSDVTARRGAELELRSREEHFRALIEYSSDVTMLLDADGRTTFVSPSFSMALGFRSDEVVGLRPRDLVHPDDLAHVVESRHRLLRTPGSVDQIVLRARHRDGTWRTFDSVSRNLLHVPSVSAIVSNLRDITEQRRLEEQYQQAQKLESIGRLAGGLAHDFNNMLTAILGYAELLEADPGAATGVDDVREIRRAGERARDLTQQLLAFARRQVISPQAVDLNEVVRASQRFVRRLVREDIEIVTELRPNLGFVRVDPAQIEQVILNLAINAADAMPTGGRLTIETAGVVLDHTSTPSPDAGMVGPHVMMVVTDTGVGIDDKDLPHVFEPFYTTKAAGEGTGLGLATVYGIVKQSGGHLFAASTVGVGTTFRLYFPQFEHGTTAVVPDERDEPSADGTETILLVEDDETVRRLATRALRDVGYHVLVARAPAEALQLAESIGGAVDLLLTDLVMPGMSGTALAAQMGARFSGIRVLYASGYAQDAAVSHGALEPGVDFLAKPFTPSTLRAAVRRVLDRL